MAKLELTDDQFALVRLMFHIFGKLFTNAQEDSAIQQPERVKANGPRPQSELVDFTKELCMGLEPPALRDIAKSLDLKKGKKLKAMNKPQLVELIASNVELDELKDVLVPA